MPRACSPSWRSRAGARCPDYGPLCAKAANAAINGLAELPEGAAQLGRIRGQLKRPTAVAAVDAAIDRAAERLGIARAEFEERAVPDFGLDAAGTRTVELGEHTAVLDGAGALTFRTATRPVAQVGAEGGPGGASEELAELKRTAKDIKAMATAPAPAARAAADRGPHAGPAPSSASATSSTDCSRRSPAA